MTDPPSASRILVYVDASRHWIPSVRAVGELATATGAAVTLLTTEWSRAKREEAVGRAREILALPADRVRVVSRVGLVEIVLPEEARGHDLAVVGRLGSLDWLTNRLVSIHLVRRSPCSLLLVRGKMERLERLVVATEGPRHGGDDVAMAVRVAHVLGARVTVLHVRSEVALTEAAHEEISAAGSDFLRGDLPEAAHLREMQGRLAEAGIRGAVKVRHGAVVDEILSEVTEGNHDLLIIGAHEAGVEEALYYEDITALLLRACPVSVLVVRPDGP